MLLFFFFFSSRRRHTRYIGDWSSDVCSSDLDSGVIEDLARKTRAMLDAAGLHHIIITASTELDEYEIARLIAAGAPIEIGRASCRERVSEARVKVTGTRKRRDGWRNSEAEQR